MSSEIKKDQSYGLKPKKGKNKNRRGSKSKSTPTKTKNTNKSNTKIKKLIQRQDSFSFLRRYLEADEPLHPNDTGEYSDQEIELDDDKKPCPERNSDSELERERLKTTLPARCKTYDNKEEEDTILFREAPDFEYLQTYDEYLDHYVTWKDLFYFESDEISRFVITLGFRVPELLSRAEFEDVIEQIKVKRNEKRRDDVHIAWEIAPELITCPLMQALAEREVPNRVENLTSIIYIRTINLRNEEVSAWIDLRVRLKSDGELWHEFFTGKRKLIPRISDLCYYNWSTFQVRFNSSENYLVTTDINDGLQFMNKLDRKLLTVNPSGHPGDNTEIVHIRAPNYLHCMIYDHFLRVKA